MNNLLRLHTLATTEQVIVRTSALGVEPDTVGAVQNLTLQIAGCHRHPDAAETGLECQEFLGQHRPGAGEFIDDEVGPKAQRLPGALNHCVAGV